MTLHWLDWLWVASYLVGMVVMGFVFAPQSDATSRSGANRIRRHGP